MSSMIRRIERQVFPSKSVFPLKDHKGRVIYKGGNVVYAAHAPREKFFDGRGRSLGVGTNPKCTCLIARLKREARNTKRAQA